MHSPIASEKSPQNILRTNTTSIADYSTITSWQAKCAEVKGTTSFVTTICDTYRMWPLPTSSFLVHKELRWTLMCTQNYNQKLFLKREGRPKPFSSQNQKNIVSNQSHANICNINSLQRKINELNGSEIANTIFLSSPQRERDNTTEFY